MLQSVIPVNVAFVVFLPLFFSSVILYEDLSLYQDKRDYRCLNYDHSKWNHVTDRFLYTSNQANTCIPLNFRTPNAGSSWSLKIKPGSAIHNFIHVSLQVNMILQSCKFYWVLLILLKRYHEQVKHSVLLIIRLINLIQKHILWMLSKCKTRHWKKPLKMFRTSQR